MSSKPFKLGLPIMERLEPKDGHAVLRTRNREEMIRIIMRTRELLTAHDVILVSERGLRPDFPVPAPMYFAEVVIVIDMPEEEKRQHMRHGAWRVYEGKRKARIIV